ncbi:capsular polysaccharide export protein, LipB/KpsS family [Sphingomonas bacterium]|uniref:capsular polysaccharide export protein, LipB/KpsS family n=1 Tax=Sphingomonas bacterium TaxID=1895847 RepID=UPI0015753C69|nr:beta-3-deoxy-D-manno-oct-2-ulosonic acid transferase [Sphingomonas bacterium]
MTLVRVPIRVLRSPPFPGVDPAVATIEAAAADERDADPKLRQTPASEMVRAAVGGTFWGRRVVGRARLIVTDGDPPGADLSDAVVVATGDVRAARRRGALVVASGEFDPWPLIVAARTVTAPSASEIAALALAAGKPVTNPAGMEIVDADRLVARALGDRYRDPFTGGIIGVEAAIALLAHWRALIDANRGISAATGMAFWKRSEVARLLWDGRPSKLPFLKPDAAIARARREGGAVAAWPARVPADFAERAMAAGVPVRWVEDGFLRSAGLGSDLLPPLSLIVDDLWPYFDPARPSRLETLLQTTEFGTDLLARAATLRRTIVERRIGKYRVGGVAESLDLPADARLVVVIGQVEDDLSVLRGGGGLTNLSVIERARAEEPNAFIVYRPHPDVEAGHRKGAIPDPVALALVDRIDRGGSLDALLARAAALHTLTSLTGFEALMRGVRVVVHGGPFYAGWGLTEDRGAPFPRRTRQLTLDQLVAVALILYPRYLDARTGLPCTPEQFTEGFGGVGVHGGWLVRLRRWQGRVRRLFG